MHNIRLLVSVSFPLFPSSRLTIGASLNDYKRRIGARRRTQIASFTIPRYPGAGLRMPPPFHLPTLEDTRVLFAAFYRRRTARVVLSLKNGRNSEKERRRLMRYFANAATVFRSLLAPFPRRTRIYPFEKPQFQNAAFEEAWLDNYRCPLRERY